MGLLDLLKIFDKGLSTLGKYSERKRFKLGNGERQRERERLRDPGVMLLRGLILLFIFSLLGSTYQKHISVISPYVNFGYFFFFFF